MSLRPSARQWLAMLGVLLCSVVPAAQALTLSFAVSPDDRLSKVMAQRVLTAAYKELGIDLQFVPLPVRRGYVQAEMGELDGLGTTVLQEIAPTLTRIEVPVAYEETVVWATRKDFVPAGWASLQPYLIGHVAGLRYFENKLQGFRTDPAPNLEAAFRKLELGRTDVVTESRFNGCLIKQLGLSRVVMLQPSLEVLPGHHFLNQKHAALIPRITSVLRRMESDGSIRRIQAGALQEYQANCG